MGRRGQGGTTMTIICVGRVTRDGLLITRIRKGA